MKLELHAAALVLASLAPAAAAQGFQPRMGEPLRGLGPTELARFAAGRVPFNTPLSAQAGLGPAFNDTSCGVCHSAPDVGGFSSIVVTRFGAAGPPFDPLASLGGSLLQAQTIAPGCEDTIPPEANVTTLRVTPHMFGAGLVERIPDAALLALEANPPGLFVSGRAHVVQPLEGGPMRVGRFGWKAQVATLLSFSADASLFEMGFTNRLLPMETAPNGSAAILASCDLVPDPEDGPDAQGFDKIDRFTHFQMFLAPPPQTPRAGLKGELVFAAIGCADCHVAELRTGPDPLPALSNVTFRPYSDFLLHDMGSLGDGIVQGAAMEREMRTHPLWGISQRVSLMHDGLTTGGASFTADIHAAIARHDGEGKPSRDAFFLQLSALQRAQVIDFLFSLGRAEFDFENDNDFDQFDWFFIEPRFTGPGLAFGPDEPGALADADGDGDFDLADYEIAQRAFTAQL